MIRRLRRRWEQWREQRPDVGFEADDEIFEDFGGILSAYQGLSFVERYSRKEIQIWVQIELRSLEGELYRHLLVFEAHSGVGHRGVGRWRAVDGIPGGSGQSNDGGDGQELPVLVDYVEYANSPEAFPYGIPSVLRLYRLDEPRSLPADTPSYLRRAQLGRYGELGLLGGSVPSQDDQLPSQVIERGSQVMDTVADNERPSSVRRRRIIREIDVVKSVSVYLADELICRIKQQPLIGIVESVEMEPCSLYFDVEAVERGWLPLPTPHRDLPSEA